MEIRQATVNDMEGIRALLAANHADTIKEEDKKDGFVTTAITDEQLKALIEEEDGVTVAAEDGKILAFAFAAPWEFWKDWPFFVNMIDILPDYTFDGTTLTEENTYQYGPVCLDKSIRGNGVFEQVFFQSLSLFKDRYPIMATFINQINPRSYAAHTKKAGMTEVGTFSYNNNNYYMMACYTDPEK